MSIEGSLGDFRLQEILQAVAQQRRTGILTIQSETTIVAVSFLAGGVVSADSLAHTVEERLGDALVAEGLLEEATVRELTRRQEGGEGRLVDLLVSDGLLSRDEVLDALRRQNQALLLELLEWEEGEFKFYGGDEVAYEEGIEPIAIDELLLTHLEGGDTAAAGDGEPGLAGWPDLPAEVESGGWSEDPGIAAPGPVQRSATGRVRPFGGSPGEAQTTAAALPVEVPLVDRPSEPEQEAPRAALVERRPAERATPGDRFAVGRSLAPLLGLLLAVGLVVSAVIVPAGALVPFPWQAADRRAAAEIQRLADRLAVDRAAKTFFLLEGHFPDRFEELVALGLLDGEDRVGPRGERLELVAGEESYDIVAAGVEQPLWSEAISGNFLLDPELRGGSGVVGSSLEPPLVLLD